MTTLTNDEIHRLRSEERLTMQQIADLYGVTKQAVSKRYNKWLTRTDTPKPVKPEPEHVKVPGHIYVIESSNGIIKVGFSRRGQARIDQHASQAGVWGLTLTQTWLSPPLSDALLAEQVLILWVRGEAKEQFNAESYRGNITFQQVRDFASTLAERF